VIRTIEDAALVVGQLPLPAALYGVFVFPFVWGLTEQMTYNGYLVPRLRVLCRSTVLSIALVATAWSFQHAVMLSCCRGASCCVRGPGRALQRAHSLPPAALRLDFASVDYSKRVAVAVEQPVL
jgi:hypothetical protein